MSRHPTYLPVLLGLALAASGAGCGSTDEQPTSTTAAVRLPPKALSIKLSNFRMTPALNVAPAGRVTISARNVGTVEHELIVARVDSDSENLAAKGDRVDEDGLGARVLGEISELKPTAAGAKTFDLKPGNYILFCNLPGHFKLGMFGRLSVS
jgi:uncharacterized cupredoxin-like copper-binding protein